MMKMMNSMMTKVDKQSEQFETFNTTVNAMRTSIDEVKDDAATLRSQLELMKIRMDQNDVMISELKNNNTNENTGMFDDDNFDDLVF